MKSFDHYESNWFKQDPIQPHWYQLLCVLLTALHYDYDEQCEDNIGRMQGRSTISFPSYFVPTQNNLTLTLISKKITQKHWDEM